MYRLRLLLVLFALVLNENRVGCFPAFASRLIPKGRISLMRSSSFKVWVVLSTFSFGGFRAFRRHIYGECIQPWLWPRPAWSCRLSRCGRLHWWWFRCFFRRSHPCLWWRPWNSSRVSMKRLWYAGGLDQFCAKSCTTKQSIATYYVRLKLHMKEELETSYSDGATEGEDSKRNKTIVMIKRSRDYFSLADDSLWCMNAK